MSNPKRKRKSWNLRKKREIAKSNLKEKKTIKQLKEEFNVTDRVVRTSIDMSDELLNLRSDDPVLEGYYMNKSKANKLINIDEFIFLGMRKIRQAGGNVLRGNIIALALDYKVKIPNVKLRSRLILLESLRKGII